MPRLVPCVTNGASHRAKARTLIDHTWTWTGGVDLTGISPHAGVTQTHEKGAAGGGAHGGPEGEGKGAQVL